MEGNTHVRNLAPGAGHASWSRCTLSPPTKADVAGRWATRQAPWRDPALWGGRGASCPDLALQARTGPALVLLALPLLKDPHPTFTFKAPCTSPVVPFLWTVAPTEDVDTWLFSASAPAGGGWVALRRDSGGTCQADQSPVPPDEGSHSRTVDAAACRGCPACGRAFDASLTSDLYMPVAPPPPPVTITHVSSRFHPSPGGPRLTPTASTCQALSSRGKGARPSGHAQAWVTGVSQGPGTPGAWPCLSGGRTVGSARRENPEWRSRGAPTAS